jgi:hypothetical protein
MGNQQLKGSRNLKNSHLLTYISIGITTKGQHHIKNKRFQHGMNIVETTLHKIQIPFAFLEL